MNTDSELLSTKTSAYKMVLFQVLLAVTIACLLLITTDLVTAYSALLGGAASVGPSSFFARCAFRYSAAKSPGRVLKWFMIGEFGKLAMTALIFALCIVSVKPLVIPAMFITFLIVTVVNLVGLAILNSRV